MKIFSLRLLPCLILAFTLTRSNAIADSTANEKLPYEVAFKLGSSVFAPGDNITIKEVRGTSKKIAVGGTYSVSGTYTLSSRDEARLSFFGTSLSYSGPTPIDPRQTVRIQKGSGSFYLVKTMADDSYLHVSFYSGEDFGGVYFGQGDRIYHGHMSLQSHNDSITTGSSSGEPISLSGPNKALLEYLGNPVLPPANMDERYTAQGLTATVLLAARNANIEVKNIMIDDSEFPFLVGVICGGSDVVKLKNELKKIAGYEYGGGVGNDVNSDGSDTCNVFNIVPYRAFPSGTEQQIYHRLILRAAVFNEQINNQRADLVPTHAQAKLPTMMIYLGNQTLEPELALTTKEQITGMMFRTNIQETDAMLFVLHSPQQASFWMKNCPESLSAAYIGPDGVIEEIHQFEANDSTPVFSTNNNIQFVLETKDGWFQRHDIGQGMAITTAKGTLSETFLTDSR